MLLGNVALMRITCEADPIGLMDLFANIFQREVALKKLQMNKYKMFKMNSTIVREKR